MISPYYNKPTQDGIFRHYKMIAAAVDLPLIVYNIPGRTASNIAPETFARLCEIRNIVGIKEASGSMDQVSDIRRLCGDRLTILSGDDSLTLPLMALGAKDVVATVGNVMPRETHELAATALAGTTRAPASCTISSCRWCARCWWRPIQSRSSRRSPSWASAGPRCGCR